MIITVENYKTPYNFIVVFTGSVCVFTKQKKRISKKLVLDLKGKFNRAAYSSYVNNKNLIKSYEYEL